MFGFVHILIRNKESISLKINSKGSGFSKEPDKAVGDFEWKMKALNFLTWDGVRTVEYQPTSDFDITAYQSAK